MNSRKCGPPVSFFRSVPPFALSLPKDLSRVCRYFDRLSANGLHRKAANQSVKFAARFCMNAITAST